MKDPVGAGRFRGWTDVIFGVEVAQDILADVVRVVADAVPAADEVSITMPRGHSHTTPAATDPKIAQVDAAQYRAEGGPCKVAATEGKKSYIPDVSVESRWSRFVEAANAADIKSVLSLPLTLDDRVIGSLNLYACTTDAFDAEQQSKAEQVSKDVVVTISNTYEFARLFQENEDLRDALVSRELIGVAKGILMSREGVSNDVAFDMLRTASQTANRKLRDVARDVIRDMESRAGG